MRKRTPVQIAYQNDYLTLYHVYMKAPLTLSKYMCELKTRILLMCYRFQSTGDTFVGFHTRMKFSLKDLFHSIALMKKNSSCSC